LKTARVESPKAPNWRGFPLFATALVAGLSVTTVSLQAAEKDPVSTSARFAERDCDVGITDIGPDGRGSAIQICGHPDQSELPVGGGALGIAMKAEAGNAAMYSHTRMPELLSLRLTAARAEVDSTLPAVDRLHMLTRINREIASLELEISQTALAR
jgi:hypothetical protein